MSGAYESLKQMQAQARDYLGEGSAKSLATAESRGFAFSVNGQNFYCSADTVKEVLKCPELVPVPQTKAWLRGLANSKGVLYSVVDLAALAGVSSARQRNQKGHLMILADETLQSALLVDRVSGFGAFEFPASDHEIVRSEANEWWDSLNVFTRVVKNTDGESWVFIDLPKLIASELYLEVQ